MTCICSQLNYNALPREGMRKFEHNNREDKISFYLHFTFCIHRIRSADQRHV